MTELCTANSAMIVILIIFDLLSPTESKTMCVVHLTIPLDLRDKLEKTLLLHAVFETVRVGQTMLEGRLLQKHHANSQTALQKQHISLNDIQALIH